METSEENKLHYKGMINNLNITILVNNGKM